MRSLWLLLLVVSFAYAGNVQPVYRAPPTIVTSKSLNTDARMNNMNPAAPAPQTIQAEEREGQSFPNTDSGKAVNSVVNPSQAVLAAVQTVSNGQTASLVQPATVLPTATVVQPSNVEQSAQYPVYMQPVGMTRPYTTPYTNYVAPIQTAYDGQAYLPQTYQGQTSPSNGFLNNIPWQDVLVALSSLALVGIGASMAYPVAKSLRSRAIKELSEMNSEDTMRMAKSVMTAIRRLSELNKSD